jgi:hypothetical protein
MLLTGSTTDFGGLAVPTESAFRICFIVGAAAAFAGMLIAGLVPLSRGRDQEPVEGTRAEPEVAAAH